MEIAAPAGTPSPANVLFYVQPEALNSELHAKLGIHTVAKPYGFAAGAKSLPLSVTEFVDAAVNYPIIFSNGDVPMPMAVTGLAEEQNLFVNADGSYLPGAYIPAFVRRFPFIVAEDPEGERLIVCIERATDLVSEQGDVKLFENGEPTEYTKGCINFCGRFEEDRRRTQAFCEYLKSHDLFHEREITQPVLKDGQPARIPLTTVVAVSEEKLNALSPEVLVEMRENGALIQIYAHLVSLANWDKLLGMRTDRESRGELTGLIQ